jgi:DNA invertase Pin-like site-specific DNA recombinase
VNPEHLEIGTQKDNIMDAIERGSFTIGSNNGCAKLTEEQVKQIRNLAKTSTQRSLSKYFGVSPTQIWKIINRKKWAHVA